MKTLKHLCFIGIAVLFVSAMVSCDFVEKPDVQNSNIVGYTEDGTPLVSLKIGTSASRALTTQLAQLGADFYEVAFFDTVGGKYYRTSWNFTEKRRVTIPTPASGYPSAAEAILFAGKSSDKTLLAVGIITDPPSGIIAPTTDTIVFGLTPLTTNVTAATSSSFQITGPTNYSTSTVPAPFPKTKVGGSTYPVFKVPESSALITATFTVGGIATGPYNTGIMVGSVNTAIVSRVMFTGEISDTGSSMAKISLAPTGGIAPAANSNVLNTGTFTITGITTTADIGFAKMAIEIPVTAISLDATNGEPHTWYIRGGLQNYLLDAGSAIGSPGGSILLGVGTVDGYLVEGNF
jgi:hypothetical protein